MTRLHYTLSAATAALIGTTTLATPAFADDPLLPKKPFKAEMIIMTDGETIPMTMYHSKSKMRIEMDQGGQEMVQIIDLTKGEAFMLMDMNGQKTAMKVDVADAVQRYGMGSSDLGRATGKKKIAGQRCKTYTIQRATVCLTKHNIAMESVSPDGTARVTDLDIGRQKAKLFDVPKGYTVMDMGGLMGGFGVGDVGSLFEGLGQSGGGSDAGEDLFRNIIGGASGIGANSSAMDELMRAANEEDDEVAGEQMFDSMMRAAGVDLSAIPSGTTTGEILATGVDGMMFENDEERLKWNEMQKENDRLATIMREQGIAGMLRENGMSEEQIAQQMAASEKMQRGLADHAEKMRAQEAEYEAMEAAGTLPQAADMVSIEDESAALDAKMERAMADGELTEAEKKALEQDAMDAFSRLLGGK